MIYDANQLTKTRFASEWRANYGEHWQDGRPLARFFQFIQNITHVKNYHQRRRLESGNSNEWDISLFFAIFNTAPFNSSTFMPHIKKVKNVQLGLAVEGLLQLNIVAF